MLVLSEPHVKNLRILCAAGTPLSRARTVTQVGNGRTSADRRPCDRRAACPLAIRSLREYCAADGLPERRTQLGLFRSSPTMRSTRHAGAGTAGSTRHYRGFNPADYKWPWPGLGAVSRGARPAPGGSLGLCGAIIGFDSTVSEDAAQAIEFAAVSQLGHRILLDFSRPAVREVAPLGCQLLHLTHGRGADHPNHLNESGGVHCRGLLARTRRTPGSLGPGIASGWRARALAPDREPVKDGRVGTGGRASPHSSRSTQRPGQRKSGTGHPQNHGDGIRTDGSHTLDLAMAPVCEGFTDSRQHILKIKVKVEPPGFSGGPGTHGAIHLLGSWSDDARRGRGGQACP
jgi:hypothetical protein